MTLARVWANGVPSMPTAASGQQLLSSADVAKLDGNLQRALDKSWLAVSDQIAGPVSLGANGVVSLDSPTSSWVASGHDFSTATGGRVECLDNDFPTFSTARARAPYSAFSEFAWSGASVGYPFPAGVIPRGDWYLDPTTLWLLPGNHNTGVQNAAVVVPITRAHDGAAAVSVSVYFAVASGRANLPTRYPAMALYRVDPFNGATTTLVDWTYFPTPANLTAYKNGASAGLNGTPNVITATFAETFDVPDAYYLLYVLDEDYDVGADVLTPNGYVGVAIDVNVADMRFQ